MDIKMKNYRIKTSFATNEGRRPGLPILVLMIFIFIFVDNCPLSDALHDF